FVADSRHDREVVAARHRGGTERRILDRAAHVQRRWIQYGVRRLVSRRRRHHAMVVVPARRRRWIARVRFSRRLRSRGRLHHVLELPRAFDVGVAAEHVALRSDVRLWRRVELLVVADRRYLCRRSRRLGVAPARRQRDRVGASRLYVSRGWASWIL